MAITNASTLAEYASGIGTQNSTLTVDSGNKRVGVGTTNPLGTFQVGSGVTFWGDAGIGSFTSLKLSGDTDSTSISTGALTVTGGVGIGLSLTVGGDVSVGGTITYEDVTNVDSLGIVTARSGLRVVGGGITCVGVATFFNDIDANGDLDVDGHTNLDNVSIAGVTTATGNITIENVEPTLNLTDSNNNSDFAVRNNDGVFGIRDTTNSADRLLIDSAGNMGLGVSPSEKLDVNGTIQCLNELRSTSGNDLLLNAGSANRDVKIQVNDTNIIYVKGSNSRVGIGSVIPQTALDVFGEITLPHNNTLKWVLGTTIKADMYSNSGGSLIFRSSSSEKFRIGSTGDVTLTSAEAGATGPTLKLTHNSASPADNDIIGVIAMDGDDDAGNATEFSSIYTKVTDVSNSSETGHLAFKTRALSSYNEIFRLAGRSSASAPSYTTDDINGIILDVYNTGNPYPRYMNFIAKSGGDTDTNISFWTEAVGGSPTEKLRITAAGRVGIGENSPDGMLHLKGSIPALYLEDSDGTHGQAIIEQSGDSLKIRQDAGNASSGTDSHINFQVDGSEKVRFTAAGLVGIGTIAPDSYLHIENGANTGNTYIHVQNSHSGGGNAGVRMQNANGSWTLIANDRLRFYDDDGSAERLCITSSGHMGLGITPSGWATNGDFRALQVGTGIAVFGRGSGDEDRGGIAANYYHTGSAQQYIGNGHAGRIYFEDGTIVFSNTGATANSSGAGAAMTLYERLKIDVNGKILLGTTRTQYSNDYYDDITINNSGGSGATGGCGISMISDAASWGAVQFGDDDNDDVGYIKYNHNDDTMRMAAAAADQQIIGSNVIDYFQHRAIMKQDGSFSIADGASKSFTITGLAYGWAKIILGFYGEAQYCGVEVSLGGLMGSGSTYYNSSILMNVSSGNCAVATTKNQTSYVVTITNNVGNGGDIHGSSMFYGGSVSSGHPSMAVS